MTDFIRQLNAMGIKWEYVYIDKQLYIKYDGDHLKAWYF